MNQRNTLGGHWAGLLRRVLTDVIPQLVLISVILLISGLALLGMIPPVSEMSQYLSVLFEAYGLPVIAIASMVENLAGLNIYFPGAIVIVVAMTLTSGDPGRAILTYLAITIPAILAQIGNYLAGRLVKRRNSNDIGRSSTTVRFRAGFFLSFAHPHTAAITSFASGASGYPWSSYLAALSLASLFWSSAYGLGLYHLGSVLAVGEHMNVVFYIYAGTWLLLGALFSWRQHYREVVSGQIGSE